MISSLRWWPAPVLLALTLVVAACSEEVEPRTELVVSAAASLTDVFEQIGARFESTHDGIEVVFNFGGSSALREQILAGAPADVFASANQSNMDDIVAAGLVGDGPDYFTANLLEIAVPPGNPAGVAGLEDFAREELFLGLCAEGVPCGDLAREALAAADVEPAADTSEPDVRALLAKVESGELDAGITYVTDVRAADGRVDGIEIPARENVATLYPIAVLSGGEHPQPAAEFVDFVLSDVGQSILLEYGFSRR
ncbi:MAG: molybdate ABC transporter substrate-binding protein [Acidimicrobiia bacterium]